MKGLEKILFFYSILALTSLTVAFGVFEPKPLNLITIGILSPILIYFWLRMTGPDHTTPDKWTLRLLASIVILAGMGIYGVYFAKKYAAIQNQQAATDQINQLKEQNSSLTAQLQDLSQQAASSPQPSATTSAIKVASASATPATSALPSPASGLSLTPKGSIPVTIYMDHDSSSKAVGTLLPGKIYPYTDRFSTWYKVSVDNSFEGWVSGTLVDEVQ